MTLSSRHRIRRIRALAVWGRARYLLVAEAPHNTDFHTWMGKKHFCFFQTAETGNRTPNSGVKGSGANHYPRAPVTQSMWWLHCISAENVMPRCLGNFTFFNGILFNNNGCSVGGTLFQKLVMTLSKHTTFVWLHAMLDQRRKRWADVV